MNYSLVKIIDTMNPFYNLIYGRPLRHVVYAIILGVVIWTVLALLLRLLHTVKLHRIINQLLGVFVILVIVDMTVISRSSETYQLQLIPLYSLIEARKQPEVYRQMLMNVFLFVPLGLTMPFALPEKVKHKVRTTVLFACAFSALIELTQVLFHLGRCETDDVLMNTLGAAIGTLSFIAFNCIKEKSKILGENRTPSPKTEVSNGKQEKNEQSEQGFHDSRSRDRG